MPTFRSSLLVAGTALALALLPAAHASLSATTPVAAGCLLVDDDACTQTWSSPLFAYFVGVAGKFSGTASITLTSLNDANDWFSNTCTGELVGVVMTSGGCYLSGNYPVGPMRVDCASVGVGTVTCSVEGQ